MPTEQTLPGLLPLPDPMMNTFNCLPAGLGAGECIPGERKCHRCKTTGKSSIEYADPLAHAIRCCRCGAVQGAYPLQAVQDGIQEARPILSDTLLSRHPDFICVTGPTPSPQAKAVIHNTAALRRKQAADRQAQAL